MIEIILPLKTPSLNQLFGRSHWTVRQAYKNKWRDAVEVYCIQHNLKPFKEFPLQITTRAKYKSRQGRDTDNTITAAKLFIDALRHCKMIPDDNGYYINRVILETPICGTGKTDETIIIIERG